MKEQLQGNQPGQLRKGILARMPSLFENRTGHGRFFDDPLALCKQFQLHLPLSRIASRRACYSPGTEQWDKGPLAHAKSCQAFRIHQQQSSSMHEARPTRFWTTDGLLRWPSSWGVKGICSPPVAVEPSCKPDTPSEGTTSHDGSSDQHSHHIVKFILKLQ